MKKEHAILISGITVFVIGHLTDLSEWEVVDPMPEEAKELYSEVALMPGLADHFERYAIRGGRDCDYMVETCSYDSYDEMCEELPEGCDFGIGCALAEGTHEETADIYGDPVKRYEIRAGLPLLGENGGNGKKRNAHAGAFIYYYILEYPDGTYRFAVLIRDV